MEKKLEIEPKSFKKQERNFKEKTTRHIYIHTIIRRV